VEACQHKKLVVAMNKEIKKLFKIMKLED